MSQVYAKLKPNLLLPLGSFRFTRRTGTIHYQSSQAPSTPFREFPSLLHALPVLLQVNAPSTPFREFPWLLANALEPTLSVILLLPLGSFVDDYVLLLPLGSFILAKGPEDAERLLTEPSTPFREFLCMSWLRVVITYLRIPSTPFREFRMVHLVGIQP